MKKSIRIWENELEISKEGLNYMISDKSANLFIHVNKLKLRQSTYTQGWLSLHSNNNSHIGSIWISTDTDMKKVRKFLEETEWNTKIK